MRALRGVVGLVAVGMLTSGCGADVGVAGDAARIDTDLIAALSGVDAGRIGEAVNTFGFDLFEAVGTGENVVLSPLSVATALAMVAAGADGDTAREMVDVLHLAGPRDDRVGALLGQLAATEDVELTVANAIFAAPATTIRPEYRDDVTSRFGATIATTDLGSPRGADEVDAWVEDHTQGRIDQIAQAVGLPDPDLALVLVDAVYFLGGWTNPFDPADTHNRVFTLLDGHQVDVPTMHTAGLFALVTGDGFRMLELPYGTDGRVVLRILLPDPDRTLADVLDPASWQQAGERLVATPMEQVALPRVALTWQANLNEVLATLGMPTAFSPAANFDLMAPEITRIDTVVHKTYLRIDEHGTEAAAVTAVGMDGGGPPSEPERFIVDRPFAFTITDTTTGTILFLGTITDPRT